MAVITLSRTYGCGARELARELAKELKYFFFEKEVIPLIAQRLDLKTDSAQKHDLTDELPRSIAEYVSFRFALLRKESINPEEYTEALRDIFLEMARVGNAIIIGHGAQFILQHQPGVLHIRLVADIKDRLEHLKTNHLLRLVEVNLVQKVKKEDRRRQEFLKMHFHHDGEDPLLYHLVINLSKLGRPKAKETILCLL